MNRKPNQDGLSDKTVAIALAAIAVVASLGLFVRGPFFEGRELTSRLQEAQRQPQALTPTVNADRATAAAVNRGLGKEVSIATLRADAARAEKSSGVQLLSLKPLKAPRGVRNASQGADLEVSGDFPQIMKFAEEIGGGLFLADKGQIRGDQQFYLINSFSIAPSATSSLGKLQVSLPDTQIARAPNLP